MKQKISFMLVGVVAMGIATFNVLNMQKDKSENNLRLANIIALSDEPGESGGSSEWGCGGNPTYIPYETLRPHNCQIWGANGTQLICQKIEQKVCCDPSKQTTCSPIDL